MKRFRNIAMSGLLAVGCLATSTYANVLVGFDTVSEYDNNFVELAVGNPSPTADAAGYVLKASKSDASATGASLIYNAGATGGVAGSGGTTFNVTRDTFGATGLFTVQADIAFATSASNNTGGTSFGFYTKVPTGQTSGYAALFRILSGGTSADFRLFDSNGNPNSAGVGAQIGSTQVISGLPAGTFVNNAWYTIQLQVADVGSNVAFTAAIYTQAGSLIHTFSTLTDTTSAILGAGQVGMRLSNSTGNDAIRFDNFTVIEVPEPASIALLSLAGLCLLGRKRHA